MRKKTSRLICFFSGHNYLPKKKMARCLGGTEEEIDYLECSRCGTEYYFIFNNYRHLDREWKMWKAATKRAKAQGAN